MEGAMRTHLSGWLTAGASLFAIVASSAWCQTPETPYERSMKQQEQYDLQQQNAQQQRQLEQQQSEQQWQQSLQQSQAQQNAAAAQGQQVLQSWQQRPPLAPDHNPLLGRWNSLGSHPSGQAPANGDMAALAGALIGGLTGGMCDSMLGRGLVEFRAGSVVAIGAGGREQLMYHAAYRGGGTRVVVLPQGGASFTHMIIDFNGPDRATVAAVGCGLTRVGHADGATVAATAPPAVKWEKLGTLNADEPVGLYVDRAGIRKAGNVAQMPDLMDFRSMHTFAGSRVLSVRNEYAYDCSGVRRRMLSTRGFDAHMGRGGVVAADDNGLAWEPIPANSPFMAHWKAACGK
jgi:hypothetical protein